MRKITVFLLISIILSSLEALGADVKTVKGVYTHYGDPSQSAVECRRLALEGARLQALADAFGTVVSQDLYQKETVSDKGESLYFSALNATEVKGEWLGDEGTPKYELSLDNDGNMVVKCTVTGKARAISNEAVDFYVKVLRNGKDAKFADTHFRSGDDLYMLFKSPVDGYLAIYMIGEDDKAYRLLPYSSDAGGEVKIKHGDEYLFFDPSSNKFPGVSVDELSMITDLPVERNSVYAVFSPKKFSIKSDSRESETMPPQLSMEQFSKWLSDSRRRDPQMGVKIMHIELTQK